MEKQQQLMQMHENFRNRMKVKKDETDSPSGKQQSRTESSSSLPRSPKSPKSPGSSGNREKDQYAKMLRQAYQNMGRLQQRNHIQTEVDIKKFNNIELGMVSDDVDVL